jgi:hypothetical protein
MNIRWTSLLAVFLIVAALPLVPAKAVVVKAPYGGSSLTSYGGLADCQDAVQKIGIVCVGIPVGTTGLDVHVNDLVELVVGGSWYLHAADGSLVGMGSYCNAFTLPLSGDAATIVVRVEGGNGPIQCLNEGRVMSGPSAMGIVALRLR